MMSKEENKAIVRRFIEEVWHQKNLTVIDEIFATDYIYHMAGMPDIQGPEGFEQFVTTIPAAFPDIQFTIEDMFAEGDMVAIRVTFRGTHQGELMGIPPTGKQVTVTGIGIQRIADGKFQETWDSFDMLGLMQQLGVVPPMGQSEE
jgi:steroid delta-isomerase-like uncharacterized protein